MNILQAGEAHLIFQGRKVRLRGASRLTLGHALAQGKAGRRPAILMSPPGLCLPPAAAFLGEPGSRWKENTQLAYRGSHKYNNIQEEEEKEEGGRMLRARMSASEKLCSRPRCEQGSCGSLGLLRERE